MSFHSQTIIRKNGFKSIWEIDEEMLDNSGNKILTKPEVVEGMPDVKCHLECDNDFPLYFYIIIESKNIIECSLKYQFSSIPPETLTFDSNGNYRRKFHYINREDLPKYVKNGKITFEIEANFSYKDAKVIGNNIVDGAELGLRLKESASTDFDIFVDGQTIGIHKFMVTAESPVFGRMFESGLKESKEKKVTITDFKKEVVQAAMDYCYRQDITVFLKDHQKSMEHLRFCDKYDFQTLKPKLEKQIISSLSKENVFYIASKADTVNSPEVRQACIDFIRPLFNVATSWTNVDVSEIDGTFFKNIIDEAFDMNNGV